MWDIVVSTLRDEFSDLSDPAQFVRVASRLLLAVVLGAVVGFEREVRGKTAGLRTHMLVALGVALVVVAAQQSDLGNEGVSRVLQGLLAGIGFLGAGAILKQTDREEVKGLTTAASIWATACIATAAALGREATAVLATLLVLVILSLLLGIEKRIDSGSRDTGPTEDRHDGAA